VDGAKLKEVGAVLRGGHVAQAATATQKVSGELAEMEERILERINNLGIGPGGLGGRITALDVKVMMVPCHIASLPLAVNINCHSSRHAEINF
jgi:tartrate dehydratase alpha subunit/fumarate hydratase class I-like protein